MTAPLLVVGPETPVVDIARVMREEDIGAVLVTEGGQLRGVVTEDSVVRGSGRVADACTDELVSVSPEDDIDHAAAVMREHSLARLPVIEHGRPVGIVSLADLASGTGPLPNVHAPGADQ
ncbi:CBS domain-containing protein [Streptomyces sp. NPDC000229]